MSQKMVRMDMDWNLKQGVPTSSHFKAAVTAVQFVLFNFANKKDQRSETNKYVSWALFLKLQAAGINFETLLGWTVFKNPNFSPFQSSSVWPIRDICCMCYVILTFL